MANLAPGGNFSPADSTDPSPRYQSGTVDDAVTAKGSTFSGGMLRLAVNFIRISPPTAWLPALQGATVPHIPQLYKRLISK